MDRISFQNFRQFAEFNPIEFKGITFLVGKNNSGKSTLIKALLLVNKYLKSDRTHLLEFSNNTNDDINISTYGRAKNKFNKLDFIKFKVYFDKYQVRLLITGESNATFGRIKSFQLKNYETNTIILFNPYESVLTFKRLSGDIETKLNIYKSEILKNNLIAEIKALEASLNESSLDRHSKAYLLERDKINKLKSKIESMESNLFSKINDERYSLSYILESSLEMTVKEACDIALDNLLNQYESEYHEIQNNIEQSDNFVNLRSIKEDMELFRSSLNDFNHYSKAVKLHFLPAQTHKQSSLFIIQDKTNLLAQAIHDYAQLRILKGEVASMFVEHWMKEFDIGDQLKIDQVGGEAYEVTIINNKKSISLADKGTGTHQLMRIILKAASIIHVKQKRKFITPFEVFTISNLDWLLIEEPELNLHPDFQSKLADLFYDLFDKNKISTIIETHSEYIIRRTQVIVAEKELEITPNTNPFIVHYFVSEKDKTNQPFEIKFNKDGTFQNNFGTGFFDEASQKTLDLIRIKRLNKQ